MARVGDENILIQASSARYDPLGPLQVFSVGVPETTAWTNSVSYGGGVGASLRKVELSGSSFSGSGLVPGGVVVGGTVQGPTASEPYGMHTATLEYGMFPSFLVQSSKLVAMVG